MAARSAADMVGNLVAKVATRCRAEPSDLYAATRIAWSDGWLAPGSAPDPRAAPSAAAPATGPGCPASFRPRSPRQAMGWPVAGRSCLERSGTGRPVRYRSAPGGQRHALHAKQRYIWYLLGKRLRVWDQMRDMAKQAQGSWRPRT